LPGPVDGTAYNVSNHQVAFGAHALTYDLNGSLVQDGVNAYVWDARSRLIGITGATAASFVYDALGRRRDSIISGAPTGFLYDGVNSVKELASLGGGDLLTGAGVDEYLTRTGSGGMMGFMTDALGSTIALTGVAGSVQAEYTYEPFGNEAGAISDNAFRYTGRESDGTGLYYYRARFYQPVFQRFLSEDPIRFAAGDANLYAYVTKQPDECR
jgi:RHS repeat-associated protein